MPALPMSAIASPSASMAEASRKLPLSLTRFAADGSVPIGNVFWPMASEQRLTGLDRRGVARGDDEELARGRHVRPPEHRRGDVALSGVRVRLRQPLGERDADRAHRDMDRALRQMRNETVRLPKAMSDAASSSASIVITASPRHASAILGCFVRAELRRGAPLRPGLRLKTRDVVSGLHEIGRHRRAHVAKSDKSKFHVDDLRVGWQLGRVAGAP